MSDGEKQPAEDLRADAVRVLAGSPTEEELAAVVAVLAAAAAVSPEESVPGPIRPSAWARSQRALRTWDQGASWS